MTERSSPSRNNDEALLRLHRRGGIHPVPDAGVIRVTGKDGLDFLQRLTTNDLKDLAPGHVRETIVTTDRGRIIDVVLVVSRPRDMLLLTSPGQSTTVAGWLERYVIMDDVRLEDMTATYSRLDLVGEETERQFLRTNLPEASGMEWGYHQLTREDVQPEIIFHRCLTGPATSLLYRTDESEKMESWLECMTGIGRAAYTGDDVYEPFRIARGYPRVGGELTMKTNPLEAGAAAGVSFTKGCYIGQEVIARLDTYQKVQRQLTGLLLESPPAFLPVAGTALLKGEETAGFLTSCGFHAVMGAWIGLGLVRRQFAVIGETLHMLNDEGVNRLRVSELPMPIGEPHA